MSAQIKDCPQPDYPIRERAYTTQQLRGNDMSTVERDLDRYLAAGERSDALAEGVIAEMEEMMGEPECVRDWLDLDGYPGAVYGLLADLMECGIPGYDTDGRSDSYRDRLNAAVRSLRRDFRAWADRDPCNGCNSIAERRVQDRWADQS